MYIDPVIYEIIFNILNYGDTYSYQQNSFYRLTVFCYFLISVFLIFAVNIVGYGRF